MTLTAKWMLGMLPLAALAPALLWPAAAQGTDSTIDWTDVPAKRVDLFFPGKASWEWVLSPSEHRIGGKKIRQGHRCMDCHADEEREMGPYLMFVSAAPQKRPRGRAHLPVDVKAAHDGENLYLRLKWCRCGEVRAEEPDPDYELKVTVMLDDGAVRSFDRVGCWAGCHEDNDDMAITPGEGTVPKYLPESRSRIKRVGGGFYLRPSDELQDMRNRGVLLEYWQARVNRDEPADAVHGYVLDRRYESQDPMVSATAGRSDGAWTVVLSRPLVAGDAWHKPLLPGRTYTLGIAVHEAYATGRRHLVSFEHTLVLDEGEADLVAVRRERVPSRPHAPSGGPTR